MVLKTGIQEHIALVKKALAGVEFEQFLPHSDRKAHFFQAGSLGGCDIRSHLFSLIFSVWVCEYSVVGGGEEANFIAHF